MEVDHHVSNHIIKDSMDVSADALHYNQVIDTTDLEMENPETIKS